MYDAATLKYSGVVNKETGERVYSDAVIENYMLVQKLWTTIEDYQN
jgi:hypothetical protein